MRWSRLRANGVGIRSWHWSAVPKRRHFANNHSNGTTPAPRTVTGCPDLVCPGTGASQSSSAGRSAVRSIVFDGLRSPAACQCRMRDDDEHALARSRERRMWQGGRPRRELVPPPSRQSVAATCGETCQRSCRALQALMDPVGPDKRTCPPPLPALPVGTGRAQASGLRPSKAGHLDPSYPFGRWRPWPKAQ